MERVTKGISRFLAVVAALAVVVLMLAIVVDVTARFITGRSVPSMVEISESSLVVAIFFGLAWSALTGAHVAVTLVADRVSERVNRVFEVLVWLVGSAATVWFMIGTVDRAISATALNETRMGLVQWPLWPLRWVIVIGFAALLLVCLVNLVRALRGREPIVAKAEEN